MEINLSKGNALVIVAHPDDETIWMGGLMLVHPDINWTILALCRKYDADRAPKFKKVVKKFGAKGIIADLEDDDDRLSIKKLSEEASTLILEEVGIGRKFNYIFTHAKDGEYGNKRHKGVSLAVSRLIKSKKIFADEVYCFAYDMARSNKYAVPKKNSNFKLKLKPGLLLKKRKIINELYGFGKNSFEYLSSSDTEAFNKF